MSLICLIDMTANTAYSLDAKQKLDNDEGTRINTYGNQVVQLAPKLRGMGDRIRQNAQVSTHAGSIGAANLLGWLC